MSEHEPRTVERHCDVAVVGGSAAGLAAALQLARQRRSVIVVDSGEPRNAPATHMHSFLGRDGTPPGELIAAGREDVRRYGGEVLQGRVERVTGEAGSFRLDLVGGHAVHARRIVVATGLRDLLPEIEGIEAHWGRDVIHCPFCHGYEVRDQRLVHLVTGAWGLHPVPLLRQLTDRLTVVVDPSVEVQPAQLERLSAGGVDVVRGAALRLREADDGSIAAVELSDGTLIDADAVVVGPRFRARAEAFEPIGLVPTPHATGAGEVLEADAEGKTAVPGVYAAGNVVDPSHQVLQAAAAGSWVGSRISFDLAAEELEHGRPPSANAADWDHRYSGEQMWSGRPNGTLVDEVSGMAPGRVLDVGAGEGGDAVWLAEQGWTVTATDISGRALERIGAEVARRGLDVRCERADANDLRPFEPQGYDLVTAMYASIPRTSDGRGVQNLLDAVAPGGTILVVSHDLEPMRTPVDTTVASRPFDPDAYVRVEDVAEVLASAPEWEIEVHGVRPRPPGAASSHHVDDVVLRARRSTDRSSVRAP